MSDSADRIHINFTIAHHNCPVFVSHGIPQSARPLMSRFGSDHFTGNHYYQCPACRTEVALRFDLKGTTDTDDAPANLS